MAKMNWRSHLPMAIAAAALAGTGRAAVSVADKDYLNAGAWKLVWIGGALPFLLIFAIAIPLALLAGPLWKKLAQRPLLALLPPALLIALFGLLIGMPWPADASNCLGLYDTPARTASLLCFLCACLCTSVLSPSLPRLFGISAAALGLLTLLGFSASFWPRTKAAWPERPNVILVSIDTQRADHLSCYGYERPTSPNIDRFAQRAVRFTRTFAPYPWTLLSHMSLFTSLNPTAHAVMTDRPLAPGIPTLAEHLRADGYHTVAILDEVKWLNPRYRFDRGFDFYHQMPGSAAVKHRKLSPLLDDLGDEPFFLFLHFFDVHSDTEQLPYDSLEDYRRLFAGDYRGDFTGCEADIGCASMLLTAFATEKRVLKGEDLDYLIALYDAGIRTFDREFGAILAELKQRGLYENSIIVLTSDHGEEFFEHGSPLHSGVHDEVVRVPLLIRTPGLRESRVEDQLLSLIDIAPTLLDLCGVEPAGMQGASFRDLLEDGDAVNANRRDWVLLEDGRERWHGIRTERWKAIRHEDERWTLFDLENDPEELIDLLGNGAAPPVEFAEIRDRYEAERKLMLKFRREKRQGARLTTTPIERAELEALGYVDEME